MAGAGILRTASGLVVFLAVWALAALAGLQLGDYWIWLGALFGWAPALVMANAAERLWPLVLPLLAGAAWYLLDR